MTNYFAKKDKCKMPWCNRKKRIRPDFDKDFFEGMCLKCYKRYSTKGKLV
jgi:hypothetical protein